MGRQKAVDKTDEADVEVVTFSVGNAEHVLDKMHNSLRLHATYIVGRENAKVDLDAADAELSKILEGVERYVALLQYRSPSVWLSAAERDAKYTAAIIKHAASLQGGKVFTFEEFHAWLLEVFDDQEFWVRQNPGMLGMMLRANEHPAIQEELLAAGIHAWVGNDDLVRVVNSRWLIDEDAILEFMIGDGPVGLTCRFCCGSEPYGSLELKPVHAQLSVQYEKLIAKMGRHRALLRSDPGYTQTHAVCADYWVQWFEIAIRKLKEKAA